MSRQVYLENWQDQLEATIQSVGTLTGLCPGTPERDALLQELQQLKEMARQVRDVPPAERQMVESHVIAISVREPLHLSSELLSRLGDLFDIYRRFRTQLTWSK